MRLPGGPATLRVGAPAPPSLRSLGIVTAHNPASRAADPASNAAAHARLTEAVRALGVPAHASLAHGTGPHAAAWDEPGYAVRAPREAVVRLGEAFGQNAVVWVDDEGRVSLVCTRPGFCGAAPGDVLGT